MIMNFEALEEAGITQKIKGLQRREIEKRAMEFGKSKPMRSSQAGYDLFA